jgi:hypothetical protein
MVKKSELHFKDEKNKKQRDVYIMEFSSISELVNHCKTAEINRRVWSTQKSISANYEFTMTRNYDEAVNLLLNGYTQGAEKLNKTLKLKKLQSKEVQRMTNDIVGFQPNVPRYLQGIPTNMINTKTVMKKERVVTLIKAVNYHGGIKPSQIMDDSVKFLQLVQAIEAKGIRVNIEVVSWVEYQGSSEEIMMRVPIKKANERVNISKMSFPLTHPSMLRRIIFRSRETELRVKTSGFGYTYGQSTRAAQMVPVLLKKNEYYIPTMITEQQMSEILNETI